MQKTHIFCKACKARIPVPGIAPPAPVATTPAPSTPAPVAPQTTPAPSTPAPVAPQTTPASVSSPSVPANIIQKVNSDVERQATKHGTALLGHIVWWSLGGVEIPGDDFADAVRASNLDTNDVPGIQTRGALAKALKSLKTGLTIACAKSDDKCIQYAVLSRDLRENEINGGVFVDAVQVVTYDRGTRSLSFQNDWMRDEIKAAFAKYDIVFTANEVRRFVDATLERIHAIRVRESGGVFFVPIAYRQVVERLEALLGAPILSPAQFTAFTVADTSTGPTSNQKHDLLKAVNEDIKRELAQADAVLTTLETSDRETRDSTLQNRLADYKRVREKALAYQELLAFSTAETEAALSALETRVRKMF